MNIVADALLLRLLPCTELPCTLSEESLCPRLCRIWTKRVNKPALLRFSWTMSLMPPVPMIELRRLRTCSTKKVRISPFPFTGINPRSERLKRCEPPPMTVAPTSASNAPLKDSLTCIRFGSPVVCIRAAVLTVSPNRQYLGSSKPTTPARTGPTCRPIRIWNLRSSPEVRVV